MTEAWAKKQLETQQNGAIRGFKIRIGTIEHYNMVMNRLVKLGYKWYHGGGVEYREGMRLYLNHNKLINFSDYRDGEDYFYRQSEHEVTIEDLEEIFEREETSIKQDSTLQPPFEVELSGELVPTKADIRKGMPVTSGVLLYFPDAIREVAKASKVGNDQHHPDQPLHWDKSKSTDEYDAMVRHLLDHHENPIDDDGVLHLAKVAWRALAGLQRYMDSKGLCNDL